MAVAFDAATKSLETTTSPLTWSHTCTGSNLLLVVGITTSHSTSPNCTGVTYNGVSMTKIGADRDYVGGETTLWYLLAPTTGANTISAAFTGGAGTERCFGVSVSYTGVAQTGQPDAVSRGTSNGSYPS